MSDCLASNVSVPVGAESDIADAERVRTGGAIELSPWRSRFSRLMDARCRGLVPSLLADLLLFSRSMRERRNLGGDIFRRAANYEHTGSFTFTRGLGVGASSPRVRWEFVGRGEWLAGCGPDV